MKKKVYELAKEMGVRSKDLIARAGALGIEVKSHMSSLTDEEIGKIRDGGTPETGKAKTGKGGSSQTNSGAAGKETAAALRGKETGAGNKARKSNPFLFTPKNQCRLYIHRFAYRIQACKHCYYYRNYNRNRY